MQAHSSAAWSDTAAHKSGFVTANGTRVHYLDWGGSGPVLILIHGGLDNATVSMIWRRPSPTGSASSPMICVGTAAPMRKGHSTPALAQKTSAA
jgi:hypothetical protein